MSIITDQMGSKKATFFELLGGENGGVENIRSLVDAFYDVMDTDPAVAGIRAMHPDDLTASREKLWLFLTGWTGGPQLYIEHYGHPFLRRRHMPFSIGESERDQWMQCMIKAMHLLALDEALMLRLAAALYDVADFMRNKPV